MISPRSCPICGASPEIASLFVAENIDASRISQFSFASRKVPEYMSHRMVRCPVCDVVYAVTPPPAEQLASAYQAASYDSWEEADDAARSYDQAIAPILPRLGRREAALEIGTGSGIFLDHLKAAGFSHLVGVEPSCAAIAAAPPARQALIRVGGFDGRDFAPESFDLICCFMVMEHVPDPLAVSVAVKRLLRPGGAFVTVTHDYGSLVNRVMGTRSPIIDIEHLQIFSRKSIREMFVRSEFDDVIVQPFANRYSLRYWHRLSPLPGRLKALFSAMLEATGMARWRVSLNVGNTIAVGFKKADAHA